MSTHEFSRGTEYLKRLKGEDTCHGMAQDGIGMDMDMDIANSCGSFFLFFFLRLGRHGLFTFALQT